MSNTKFNKIIEKEISIGKLKLAVVDILFLAVITVISFMIRFIFIEFELSDWRNCLRPWMLKIKGYGGYRSLRYYFSDYTCPYMYIMVILSYLPIKPLYGIKCVSIIFDYMVAIVVTLLVYKMTQSKKKAIIGYASTIFLPTVIMNGALWGQCDIIYTFFLLLSLYFIIKEKSLLSLIFFGVSFSLKLQAIFFLPVLVILWLKEKVKFREFLVVPVIYCLSCIPAWLVGRNFFSDMLIIYLKQSSQYKELTMNFPNIYAMLGMNYLKEIETAGVLFTIFLLGVIAYWIYTTQMKVTKDFIIVLSLFTLLVVVYFMPHMHERYGYVAEVLAVVYGINNFKKMYIPICLTFLTFLTYVFVLFGKLMMPLSVCAIAMGAIIVIVGYDLYKTVDTCKQMNDCN